MNKILISFFSVILPKIIKFLNNHAEEMLDDILNKFYKNFKEIVNDDTPKAPKLEDKPLNEQEIIKKYLKEQENIKKNQKEQEEAKERLIVEKYLKRQAIIKEKQEKAKAKMRAFINNQDINSFEKRFKELVKDIDYIMKE